MFRKIITMALVGVLAQAALYVQPISAGSMADKEARLAGKVREAISQLGVGREAVVRVRLKDKSELAGYISQVREESFVITDLRAGTSTAVAYPNVTQVKGHNLSKGAKIAIGVGIGVAILVAFIRWASQFE